MCTYSQSHFAAAYAIHFSTRSQRLPRENRHRICLWFMQLFTKRRGIFMARTGYRMKVKTTCETKRISTYTTLLSFPLIIESVMFQCINSSGSRTLIKPMQNCFIARVLLTLPFGSWPIPTHYASPCQTTDYPLPYMLHDLTYHWIASL